MEEAPVYEQGFRMSARTRRALDATDALPARLRACVHEFGYEIVEEFRQAGVTDPTKLRRLVHAAWCGARAPVQRTRAYNNESSPVLGQIDWLLVQGGAGITARTLVQLLKQKGLVIVPWFPNPVMVKASMDYTDGKGVLSKVKKHEGRLDVAIKAAAKSLWPFLFEVGK